MDGPIGEWAERATTGLDSWTKNLLLQGFHRQIAQLTENRVEAGIKRKRKSAARKLRRTTVSTFTGVIAKAGILAAFSPALSPAESTYVTFPRRGSRKPSKPPSSPSIFTGHSATPAKMNLATPSTTSPAPSTTKSPRRWPPIAKYYSESKTPTTSSRPTRNTSCGSSRGSSTPLMAAAATTKSTPPRRPPQDVAISWSHINDSPTTATHTTNSPPGAKHD